MTVDRFIETLREVVGPWTTDITALEPHEVLRTTPRGSREGQASCPIIAVHAHVTGRTSRYRNSEYKAAAVILGLSATDATDLAGAADDICGHEGLRHRMLAATVEHEREGALRLRDKGAIG